MNSEDYITKKINKRKAGFYCRAQPPTNPFTTRMVELCISFSVVGATLWLPPFTEEELDKIYEVGKKFFESQRKENKNE